MCFETLVKKISPTLKRITYKLNGHFTCFDHDDLYQEAIMRLWLDHNEGKLADKTDSYILQGCYFHLKNYIRKAGPHNRLRSLDSLVSAEDEPVKESLFLVDERSRYLRDHISDKMFAETIQNNGFSPREKTILSFCSQGFTMREIGRELGISHVRVVKILAGIREKSLQYTD
jgi:RNA polymerase sigma factor (sigma-70 family)